MDMMVDLTTLGTLPISAFVQIGGVKYDLESKTVCDEIIINIDPFDVKRYGMTVDTSTLDYWKTQPKQICNGWKDNAVSLLEAMRIFSKWVDPDGYLTTYGASLDIPILKYSLYRVGLDLPWKHYRERDARSIGELYGVKPEKEVIRFNALDDCHAQVNMLFEAF